MMISSYQISCYGSFDQKVQFINLSININKFSNYGLRRLVMCSLPPHVRGCWRSGAKAAAREWAHVLHSLRGCPASWQ
jgi:hypothetical protein